MSSSAVAHSVKRLGVIGAGQMGLGITYVSVLRARVPVTLLDNSPTQLEKGLSFFDSLLKKDVSKGKIQQRDADEARARVKVGNGVQDLTDADLVIEAVSEKLGLKQDIFRALAKHVRDDAILASNTSSISISKIAASAIPSDSPTAEELAKSPSPGRVCGVHFFNPVPVMPLVELIAGLQTRPEVLDRARSFAVACGKEVTTSKDVPGFVSNALLMPFINEAVMALEKGVATREDIDKTLRLGMNHPMGPLALADFIGLDTCHAIMETLYTETADSKYRPSVLLGRMVDAGWLGKKAGRGFYEY